MCRHISRAWVFADGLGVASPLLLSVAGAALGAAQPYSPETVALGCRGSFNQTSAVCGAKRVGEQGCSSTV